MNPATQVLRLLHTLIASTVPPSQQERARHTAARCIAVFAGSAWPVVAWRFSDLNADGCPLEICFSSADRTLRYTLEVAGPEFPAASRLSMACALANELGHTPSPQSIAHWTALHTGHPLRWGASLGVRHSDGGERLKLYLELPPSARRAVLEHRPHALLFHHDSLPIMLGHDIWSATEELYLRLPPLDHTQARAVHNALAANPQTAPLLSSLAALFPMPLDSALQWMNLGYSVAQPTDAPPRVSLFLRSTAIEPGRLKNFLQQSTLYLYKEPIAPLPSHGILSLTYIAGRIETRIGISALALTAATQGVSA